MILRINYEIKLKLKTLVILILLIVIVILLSARLGLLADDAVHGKQTMVALLTTAHFLMLLL
jgi:hypothetical protein